ncbi:hypothetical protein ACI65C_006697 [Semiaphis heraclei]
MVGRKPAIPPLLTIIEAILEFKDRTVFKNDVGDQNDNIELLENILPPEILPFNEQITKNQMEWSDDAQYPPLASTALINPESTQHTSNLVDSPKHTVNTENLEETTFNATFHDQIKRPLSETKSKQSPTSPISIKQPDKKKNDSIDFILSPIHHDNMDEPIDTYLVVSSNSIHQNNSTNYSSGCPLCNSGDFPSKNGSHKCNKCHDDDEINAAYLSEEHKSVEGWNRKPKRKRNLNSYLYPNPNLRHLQINNSKNIQSLPLLKNGSRAQELKSCTIKNIGKVILSNICAFELVNNGISSKTYTKRAELMVLFKIYNYKIPKVMMVKQKKKIDLS